MAHAIESHLDEWTAADLVQRFGAIPLQRVRHHPPPGMATEANVIELSEHEDLLCELVDGVLLEKTMGVYEAYLAVLLAHFLTGFVRDRDLGIVLGPDGMMRLVPGLIRIPDVAFLSWDRFPSRRVARTAFVQGAPDLAIEVISKSNTPEEMRRKLEEYFAAGARLVWYVYHTPRKEVWVYTSPQHVTVVAENQTLDGGDVLPGFRLELSEVFAEPDDAETPHE